MKDSLLETSVNAVQAVVKEEIQSYSSVLESAATAVKESCVSALAPSKIRTAIVSALEDRSTNLIVYGLPESSDSTDRDSIKDLFQHLDEALVMSKVERLGRSGEQVRPIRVVMRTREAARTILGKSARLKDSDLYQRVYIAPDRTFEERSERRALVARLRQMRDHEPEKVWRIRRGSIVENECESERESEREEGESEGEGESERERESQSESLRVGDLERVRVIEIEYSTVLCLLPIFIPLHLFVRTRWGTGWCSMVNAHIRLLVFGHLADLHRPESRLSLVRVIQFSLYYMFNFGSMPLPTVVALID